VTFRRARLVVRMMGVYAPQQHLVLCRQRHFPPFPLLSGSGSDAMLPRHSRWKAGILIRLGFMKAVLQEGKATPLVRDTGGRITTPPRQSGSHQSRNSH